MWFKLSLLLFLIFCSCNVSSKNLRKSLNQKVDGYGSMEDFLSPTADVKFRDGLYNGYGGEAREKQHHVLTDDSSNLNSHVGKQNGHEFDGSNFDKQHKDVLAEIQHNGYSGYKETPAKRKQLNNDSNDDKYGEQKHGRFRRSAKDRAEAIGGFFLWLLIIGGIVLCCCLPGIILCVILMRR
uniref:Uncharacterized protein n=1 Tax=Panagrolaimus davidi TaxID=227884 RepID=A0A914QXP9_9BILA